VRRLSATLGIIEQAAMHLRLFDWGPSPFCMKVRAILNEGLASGCERNVMMRCAAHFSPAERLQLAARRWIGLNWIRVGLVAISWWGALSVITRHG